jgi:hypothetical protein
VVEPWSIAAVSRAKHPMEITLVRAFIGTFLRAGLKAGLDLS